MVDLLRKLRGELSAVRKAFDRIKTTQVRAGKQTELARGLVDHYFTKVRPSVESSNTALLDESDALMQTLLEAVNRSSALTTYKKLLKSLDEALLKVEASALSTSGRRTPSNHSHVAPVDAKIISTLKAFAADAAKAYEQGLRDLGATDRLSWRGTATELREALRECLDTLAPDSEVRGQPGFQLETNTKGPTMRQKARHILRSREVPTNVLRATEAAISTVEETVGAFVRFTYDRANVSTHTLTTRDEVVRLLGYVRVALCDLLEVSP